MTKVVHINKESYTRYIGRAGHGQDGYFGNPFKMDKESDRHLCIENFENYFYDRIKNDLDFFIKVLDLKDQTLGCFCKPKACHGDIYVKFLNSPGITYTQSIVKKSLDEITLLRDTILKSIER